MFFRDDSKIWVRIFYACFLVLRWAPGDIVTFLRGSVLVPNVLLIEADCIDFLRVFLGVSSVFGSFQMEFGWLYCSSRKGGISL